ncbi:MULTISPECIES: arylsulfatase [unclassified Lentimonas]|uniref:sulfatase family protein n=1 Tax=unclassified Lentimonas TaxID=2630993 RepID=UPI001323AA41|nr:MULTISPECIES: arylsulfatase [unclassified Lentimonas]CAA6677729.1 Choline-sulfatase (EC [Lentimonas sp. CC4]CAA6684993.1 Choline-sulfatase (EC [Lentimonas sp. CC6]CAA7077892.1 Choline-sulfatase (EC [Lentimonas sp. CC4]CAA7169817.1 Choline-sulfatase (EC [Lentimonas sp. CC21]CAA7179936.1 Choline-sulfatase (EC [Lentimonas sp. CC8]
MKYKLLQLAAVAYATITVAVQAAERPNVVFFYADDMGYGEIQRFHPEASKVPTPHLNQLCDEGMMFTDAHTSASVCTPSRYALLTGRYNWRSTHQSRVVGGGKPCLIAPDRMTLASLFKEQGYQTAMFGKWHLNFEYETPKDAKKKKSLKDKWNVGSPVGTRIVDGPVTRGFDYFLGFHHSGSMSSLIENDTTIEYVDCREMMDRLTNSVVSYLDEYAAKASEEPFFLYYPMNSPHAPVVPKEEWKGRGGIEGEYPEFVAQTDDAVGQVLAANERNGFKENTIVIFGTDNGCHQSPSKFLKFGHSVSGPLRDKKASIYDGGHRIPFIVRWPEVVQAGTKSDQLICMTDIFATFSEYFAYDYANNTAEDSISFLPVLHGKEPQVVRENIVHHDIKGHFAVRSGDWKLILMPDNKAKGAKDKAAEFQLYNMQDDIAETTNLANEYPETVETLLALLKQQVADGRSTPGELQQNDAEVDLWKKDSKR